MKTIRKIVIIALALVMALSMTACKSKTQKYQESLSSVLTEISDMNADITATVTALQTALEGGDKNAYQEALSQLSDYANALKEKYQAIAAIEAPKELSDKQAQLKIHADNLCTMLDDSIELYTIAGDSLSSDLTEEQIARITELQKEISDLNPSADSFDSIFSEIMNAK
ncbi:MAG: hypothetical protein IJM83_03825 [Firmicutes bacterium]|nr:hypothetical protein [Bacillota bacterium]